MKEEVLDRTMWTNRFGGGFGPVVRQNSEWMTPVEIHRQSIKINEARVTRRKLVWIRCSSFNYGRRDDDDQQRSGLSK